MHSKIADVVTQAMSLNPDKRPANSAEMKRLLQQAVIASTKRWAGKSRIWLIPTIALIAIALVIVILLVRPKGSNTVISLAPGLGLNEFDFDVPEINASGTVMERIKRKGKYFSEDLGGGVTMDMVEIPGGTFMMGSPDTEQDRDFSEGPQHQVTVRPFFMGKFEVTQAQWRAVARLPKVNFDLSADPSLYKGDSRPVDNVSWEHAREFCDRLSRKTGRKYRLPTEAEWEYACRAETTTPHAFDLFFRGDRLANCALPRTSGPPTTSVGSFGLANPFGMYDMHGNVREWVLDAWHDNYYGAPSDGREWGTAGNSGFGVLRGGSSKGGAEDCRSAIRDRVTDSDYIQDLGKRAIPSGTCGFRVVMEAPPK